MKSTSTSTSARYLCKELEQAYIEFKALDAFESRVYKPRFKLSETLFAYFLAMTAGHTTMKAACAWMKDNRLVFARLYRNGYWHHPPSTVTLSKLFQSLDQEALAVLCPNSMEKRDHHHYSLDGKTDRSSGQSVLTVYEHWTQRIHSLLAFEVGQEVGALQHMLETTKNKGALWVTADALHTQKDTYAIAKKKT